MGASMVRRMVVWMAAIGTLAATQVVAHHAVGTVYDEGRIVTIQGTVGSVINAPSHPVVHLFVAGRDGRTRTWAIEFDDLAVPLSTRSTVSTAKKESMLEPGDQVTVCGNPGRDPGAYRVRMLKLQRSDGWLLRSDVSLAAEQCGS